MFKTILMVLVLVALCLGQDRGYNGLAWGSSSNLVQEKYPNARDTATEETPIGEVIFVDHPVAGPIENRRLHYYRDRLFYVAVKYDNVSGNPVPRMSFCNSVLAVFSDLNTKFGQNTVVSVKYAQILTPNDVVVTEHEWASKSAIIKCKDIIDAHSSIIYQAEFTYYSKKLFREYASGISRPAEY